MFPTFKSKKAKRVSLTTCLSIPFMVLYLAGTVELGSFHDLFHSDDEIALHSELQEQNSCHNAIYHQQKSNVCHHQFHITQLKKCPLCHVVIHASHLSNVRFSSEPVIRGEKVKEKSDLQPPSNFIVSLASRGPPINS